MKALVLIPLGALAIAACASTMPTIPGSDVLAAESGRDAEILDRGRALWTRECAACHRTYLPHEYSPERWWSIGPDMGDRAGLGPEDTQAVTEFLVAASRHARDDGQSVDSP